MAWIETVNEADAAGLVKEYYQRSVKDRGTVGNIVKAFSLKPELLDEWMKFSRTVTFGGSSLGRRR